MKCQICGVNKLSREFPSKTGSTDCKHPPLYCLRCISKSAKSSTVCPYEDCECQIEEKRLLEFNSQLAYLFPVVKSTQITIADAEKTGENILIANVEGETTLIAFSPDMSVLLLKEEIQKKIKIEINKQKLLYNDKDLQVHDDKGEFLMLKDYGIQRGATVHLMIVMYAIPDYLDRVIFDLSWNYPASGRDFLDATCLTFNNNNLLSTVNYNTGAWPEEAKAIEHSGDGMDDANRKGFHTIDISLKKLPGEVTHLVFALSVWTTPSMSHFPNPALRFYDAANKTKDLCSTSIAHASDSEACVMCYVKRKSKGWDIFESGHLSDGNANNYDPLLETIRKIISGGLGSKARKATVVAAPEASLSVSGSRISCGPRPVQIVFSFDTTGSMHGCIAEVRRQVQDVITRLLKDMPQLEIAVFAHGDYCDKSTYVTKFIDFSTNKDKLCSFVKDVGKTGGGDAPECYELVLHEVRNKLTWKNAANKSLVMIGDAYPHSKDEAQNYLHLDWKEEVGNLYKEKGVRTHSVECLGGNTFWKELAKLGHGKHHRLDDITGIVNLILAICYREAAPNKLKKFKEEIRGIGSLSESIDAW